jgi:hypothetical protein
MNNKDNGNITDAKSLSTHLKLIVKARITARKISSAEFSKLFYEAMDRRREELEQAANGEELFNLPSGKQLVDMRNSLYQAILNNKRPLSYHNFQFVMEDMLHEIVPDDPMIDEAKLETECRLHPEGRSFGRLTCIRRVDPPESIANNGGNRYYLCQCSCGNEAVVMLSNLLGGRTKSCGCLNSELAAERTRLRNTTHGMYGTREYNIWNAMVDRCTNEKHHNYGLYGGRGIEVCDRWFNSVENFYTDMGDRPPGMSLDRIDNDGDYEPDNCRWATAKEQSRNKRNNRLIEGKAMAEWCEDNNLNYNAVAHRLYRLLKKGMSDEDAVNAIVKHYRDGSSA